MTHSKPAIPMLHYAITPALIFMLLGWVMGCDRLPGKPTQEERWRPAAEVTDFSQLYAQNCSGCHGADGRFGAARPLNDPLYLAVANADVLRQVTAKGVSGTAMPPFADKAG